MMRLGYFLICVFGTLFFSSAIAGQLDLNKLSLATVDYEEVTIQRRFNATVEAVNKSTIAAQVSERIIEINFDVDDYLEQGVVLLRFNDAKQQARLERAQASLREVTVLANDAKTELLRIRDIYKKKLVAKAVLDKAEANYKSSLARQSQAVARLKEANQDTEQTVVRAPYSGLVTQRHVEVGETPSVGAPLMTGLSLHQLRVVADVPQRFISVLREGCCPARVILPNEMQQRVSSKKLTIFPIADSQTHSFKIRVELDEGQHGLYPGMFVKLELDVASKRKLLVPISALAQRGEVTGIYVVENSLITFRYVKSGRVHGDGRVEIHAGLEPGEKISLNPVEAGILLKSISNDE